MYLKVNDHYLNKAVYINLARCKQFDFYTQQGDTWFVADGISYQLGVGADTHREDWFIAVKNIFEEALAKGSNTRRLS